MRRKGQLERQRRMEQEDGLGLMSRDSTQNRNKRVKRAATPRFRFLFQIPYRISTPPIRPHNRYIMTTKRKTAPGRDGRRPEKPCRTMPAGRDGPGRSRRPGGSAGSGAAGDLPPEARPCTTEHRAGRACAAKAATPKKDKDGGGL